MLGLVITVGACFWIFHPICVAKLVEKLTHFDPNVTSWISSFLTQYTKFDSDCSRCIATNTFLDIY